MVNIVVMAGGKGQRFWPRSTIEMPKQFHKIVSERTMLQETFYRIYPEISKDRIYFVANEKLSQIIKNQLPEIDSSNLIIEPMGKNTAAAIGLSAVYISRNDPEGVMVVLTADHVVYPKEDFLKGVEVASKVADEGYLVTFGIQPDRPATEYGYIEVQDRIEGDYSLEVYRVKMFREKPDLNTARVFLEKGNFFWNSGMFAFKVATILGEIGKHVPELYRGLMKIRDAIGTPEEERVKASEFEKFEDISIDYAVMEKAENIACVKPTYIWDDVGSWSALYRHRKRDDNGNILEGNAVIVESEDTIVLGDDRSVIAAIGLKDIIIVKNENRILVCHKSMDQKVKDALKIMKGNENLMKYL